jgi:hypothetical protein
MPVESTVAESDLRYAFTINATVAVKKAELVLDPRCARGRFQVLCNGRKLGEPLTFPRMTIEPLRLPVSLRRGRNTVEFRFEVGNAMEGLLSMVWLEGAFGVRVAKAGPVVEAESGLVSPRGWTDMGLAHYMGDGTYRWTETLSEADLRSGAWSLELDDVMDSAQLLVNGQDQGTRAWGPWRWPLAGLTAGENTFELTVSSTAGNRLQLLYPAQPQGWLGKGRLIRKG